MGKRVIRVKAYGNRISRFVFNKLNENNEVIYYPIYNTNAPISPKKAFIYNADGNPMDTFFIRDFHTAHAPNQNAGKYILWDRYNYGLNIHFYTHQAMNETMGTPTDKYGMLIESRAIAGKDYQIFRMNRGLEREFKYIFSFDDQILNEIENSRFLPTAAAVWYGTDKSSTTSLDDELYQKKTEDISIVSSNKSMCDLHKFRIALANYCKINRLADTFGTFDGGMLCDISRSLTGYRYSIAIENNISDYFFTEKITNCFAAQTIPIYLGARKIDKFFNPDGIIVIHPEDMGDIEKKLKQCNAREYERRLPAILDNYERVKKYMNMDDYLYENYFSKCNRRTGDGK